jgi:RHS repeat-associated protein
MNSGKCAVVAAALKHFRLFVCAFILSLVSTSSGHAQAPVCDVTCTPDTGSSSYAGAAAARVKMRNARGYSSPIVARASIRANAAASSTNQTVVGSQSYNYAIPILRLPGRAGMDLVLNLYYNSRVWDVDSAGGTVTFNADRDFPSYGFRLDFGYIEIAGGNAVLTESDGTKRVLAPPNGNAFFASLDGSNIVFGLTGTGRLVYGNGTQVQYQQFPSNPNLWRPVWIKDTNGNYISIAYVAGHDQLISAVSDTVGRVINFNYMQDGSNRLASLSQALTSPDSGTRTYATFTWDKVYGGGYHWYNFSGLTVSGTPDLNTQLNVLKACTYANGTGYRFTYGDWAIITKIETLSSSTPPATRSYISYNYPPATQAQADAPSYTQEVISPDGTDSNTSTWIYATTKDGTGAVTSMAVTDPNGTVSTTNLAPDTGVTSSVQVKDSSNNILSTTGFTWIGGGFTGATLLGGITITNDGGQQSSVQYAYDPYYDQRTDIYEYDFDSLLKRHTVMTYSSTYTNPTPHIMNLPTQILVKDGAGNKISRTDLAYDGPAQTYLTAVNGASNHDDSAYGIGNTTRGNVTAVTRYSNAATGTGAFTRNFYYDSLGNLIKAQLDCCNQKKFNFNGGTQYAYADSIVRGPDGGTQFTTSATYDVNFGLVLTATDENNAVTQYQYDSMNRLTQVTLPPQQGTYVHLNTAYGDDVVSPTVTSSNTANSAVVVAAYDGLGHMIQMDANGTPASRVTYAYDRLWERTRASNPYTPGDTIANTTFSYDGLGRVIQVTPPSGGYTQYQYAGNSVTVADPAGKQRKNLSDALGRLIEVDEPGESFAGLKASGAVAVSGTLQSTVVGGQGATQATGSVTVSGNENSVTVGGGPYCAMSNENGDCVDWEYDPGTTIYDAGTVNITVNGHSDTYSYGQNSTASGITTGLTALINGDSSAFVTAAASGTTVNLTSKAYGNAANYSLSSSSTYDTADFSSPSFTTSKSGSALTGGHDAVNGTTIYDAGTVTVTIGSFQTSVSYGQNTNNTASAVASALATGLNGSSSPVSASASGSTITLTYKTVGTAGDVTVTCSSATSQGTYFPNPSFACPNITLSGGQDTYSSGVAHPYVTTYTYDVMDNLTGVSQAAGLVNGQQTAGQPRSYVYDSLGRISSATTPESGTVATYYTDAGNNSCAGDPALACRVQDARGIVKTLTYDGINRLAGVTYSDGTPSVTYQHDSGGAAAFALTRMTKIIEGSNSQTFTYDNLGRIKTVSHVIDGTTYLVQYGYNLASQLTSITYPSGRVVSQNLDAFGSMAAIADTSTTYLSSLTYNGAGQPLGLMLGNGVQGAFTYNDHLQLSTLHYFKTGTPTTEVLNLAYDYGTGNNGQIQAVHYFTSPGMEDLTKTEIFAYDPVGRLVAGQTGTVNTTPGSKTWSLQWVYDRLGNRKSQSLLNGDPTLPVGQPNFTFDPGTNRITNTGYTYDAAGNMTHDASNAYTYDGANRLKQVNAGPAYTYFGALRIKKVNSGTTTVYVYAGTKTIAEYAIGSSTPSREYVYSGSLLLATVSGANTTYHHPDHLSNRVETDSSGTVVRTFGHFPYGESWYETGTPDKWKFTTYETDALTGETGLNYAQFRSYAPGQGRFMNADLLGPDLNAPQSLNRYTYVMNDPVNFSDPLGLDTPVFRVTAHGCAEGGTKVVDSNGNFLYCDYGGSGGGGGYANLLDGLDMGGGGGGGEGPGNEKKKDPCPAEKRRFFNWLDEALGKMAADLQTSKALTLTMAAKEGGWDTKGLDHNQPKNNPFGVNRTSHGQAVGNVVYPSLAAAVSSWENQYGDRVRGITAPDDFVYELQHPAPPAKPYNTASAKTYEDEFQNIYDRMLDFMKLCGIKP